MADSDVRNPAPSPDLVISLCLWLSELRFNLYYSESWREGIFVWIHPGLEYKTQDFIPQQNTKKGSRQDSSRIDNNEPHEAAALLLCADRRGESLSVSERGKVSARREEAGVTQRQRQSVIRGSHEHGHTEGRELQDRAQEPEAEALRHREETLGDGVLQRCQQVCPRRPQDPGQSHSAPERSPHSPEILLHSAKVTTTCHRQYVNVTQTLHIIYIVWANHVKFLKNE